MFNLSDHTTFILNKLKEHTTTSFIVVYLLLLMCYYNFLGRRCHCYCCGCCVNQLDCLWMVTDTMCGYSVTLSASQPATRLDWHKPSEYHRHNASQSVSQSLVSWNWCKLRCLVVFCYFDVLFVCLFGSSKHGESPRASRVTCEQMYVCLYIFRRFRLCARVCLCAKVKLQTCSWNFVDVSFLWDVSQLSRVEKHTRIVVGCRCVSGEDANSRMLAFSFCNVNITTTKLILKLTKNLTQQQTNKNHISLAY